MKQIKFTGSLKHNELEALYEIGRAVAETVEINIALEKIIKLTRAVFIFDNIVLYNINNNGDLEAGFARAIGRGRAYEGDLAWGEMAAKYVIETGDNFVQNSEVDPDKDRLEQQFFLGLPMIVGGKITGSLLFIRFGGPSFTEAQINFSELLATHFSQLYNREKLVSKVAELEAERRLNRLQADFLAMVSHDLNTPLGFIKGYTTTLLRSDTDWDRGTQNEFLTIIDDETDRLSELIENLLDSSRLQSHKFQIKLNNHHLDKIGSSQVERLKFLYPELDINIVIKNHNIPVLVDSKRISQVIDNIINNASKYAPNSKILVTISMIGDEAQISIQDSGPGIEKDHLEKIFKRFYRIPGKRAGVRGSGLGLFICEQIIKSHRGKLLVESEVGRGTNFIIKLPVVKEEVEKRNV